MNIACPLLLRLILALLLGFSALAPLFSTPVLATDTSFLTASGNAAVTSGAGNNNGYETTPGNTTADDTAYAVSTNTATVASSSCALPNTNVDQHDFFNFGISVPAGSTINGLTARTNAKYDSNTGVNTLCVFLSWDNGTTWTAGKNTPDIGTADATNDLGGTADNWGRTWSISELGNANFRLRVMTLVASTARDSSLDYLAVSVNYTVNATKLLTALEGQTVNGTSVTGSGCPTPTGVITIAGTPTAKTAGVALNACVYATAGDNSFADTATNLVSISSTPNDAQGVYPSDANLVAGKKDFLVTLKTSGSYTISAAASGLTTGTSSSVTINPDITAKLVITTNPTSVIAGAETTQYVVTRRDQFDNPTTSGTQSVDLTSNSTGTYQFRDTSGGGSVTSVTIGAGVSTENFFYYDEKAGAWTISVAKTGLTGDSKALTVDPAAASTFTVTTEHSGTETANTSFSVTLTAKDAFGNTVSSGPNNYTGSHTINWTWNATNSPNDNVAPTKPSDASRTFTNGVLTLAGFTLTNASQTPTITGTEPSGPAGTSAAITVNPGSTTKFIITTNPASTTAGVETTQYIVQRRDSVGNPVTSGTQQVDLSSTSTSGTKQFRDTSGGGSVTFVTIGAGVSTENFFYYDTLAGTWTIQTAFTGITADSKSLTVNPDVTTKLVITTNPISVTAGQETTQYVVQRQDQFGNPTTSGTQQVNLTSTSTSGTKQFRDTSGGGSVTLVTVGAGVSTENFFYYDTLVGTWSIAVAFTGLTGDSKSLTVNPDVTAKLVITTWPASTNTNQETTQYIVERRDQFDNLTTSGTQQVNLTSNSTGTYQFRDTSGGGSVTFVTIGAGVSTENFFYIDDTEGTWTISVAFTGLTGDNKSLIVVGAKFWLVLPNQSFVDGTGTTGTAIVTANSSFSITIYKTNASNVTDTSYSGSHTINFSSTATNSPNDGIAPTIPASLSITFTNGVGTTTVSFILTNASETPTITASETSGPSGDSSAITVNPGSTTKFIITTNPASTTAGVETTQYIVQRRDSVGNPVTSGTQQVNLTSTSTGGAKQFRDTSGGAGVTFVTIAASASTENFFYYDELAGTWTIQTAFTGITSDSKSLTVNPDVTNKLVITTNPTSVTAGVETSQFIVQRQDQFGNPTISGTQTVNLTSTSTGGAKQFRDTSGGVGVTFVTIGAGVSTENFFYYDTLSGTWSIAVAFPGLTGDSKSLTVNPDVTIKLVITTNPASTTAGVETTQYIVTRRDQFDNPTTSGTQQVNLSSTSTGSNKQFRDTSGGGSVTFVTIGSGVSTENFFYYDEKSGSWSISVAFTGLTGDSKALTVNPDSTNKLVITTFPASTTAGVETTQYIVERRDQFDNLTTSGTQQVDLSSTSTSGTKQFRDTSGGGAVTLVTIGAGVSTENFFYYDTLAGTWSIAVAFAGLIGDSKSLTVNPDVTTKLVITTNPASTTAGVETTQYIVTRRDQFDNPTTSGTQTVNLSSDSTGINKQFRDTSGGGSVTFVTIGAGVSTENFFYYDEKSGTWNISVAFAGLTGDSKSLTINPGAPIFVLTTFPASVVAGQETTQYIVRREDQYGNLITSGAQVVNLASTSTGTAKQFRDTSGGAGVSFVTIANGFSTENFFYYDEKAGTWTISVSASGVTGDSESLTVNPAATNKLVIITNPATAEVSVESTAFVVQRQDQFGNPTVSGTQTVNLASNSTGSYELRDSSGGPNVPSVTIGAGLSTENFFYFDTDSGTWNISVSFGGLTGDSKSINILNLPAPSGFAGQALSTTSIRWTWTDNSASEDGFRIYSSTGTLIAQIATPNTTSYTETGLTPGTSYTRYVKAYKASSESAASNQATATTNSEPPPAEPPTEEGPPVSTPPTPEGPGVVTPEEPEALVTYPEFDLTWWEKIILFLYQAGQKAVGVTVAVWTGTTQVASEVTGIIGTSVSGLAKAAAGAASGLANTVGNLVAGAGEAGTAVASAAVEQVQRALQAAVSTGNRVVETLAASIKSAEEQASRAVRAAEGAVTELARAAQKAGSDLTRYLADAANSAGQAAQNFGDAVAGAVGSAGEQVGGLAQAARDGLADATSSVERFVGGVFSDGKDLAGRLALGADKFREIIFDREPTAIRNVKVEVISSTKVAVSWTTNHLATSKVNFGSKIGEYEYDSYSGNYTREHRQVLTALEAGQTYFFEIISQNGTVAVDAFRSFTTPIK